MYIHIYSYTHTVNSKLNLGGIHRGLVFTTPISDACVSRFDFRLVLEIAGWPSCFMKVQHCGGLSMVLLKRKDLLELLVKRREFCSGFGFLSRRNMTYRKAVESKV